MTTIKRRSVVKNDFVADAPQEVRPKVEKKQPTKSKLVQITIKVHENHMKMFNHIQSESTSSTPLGISDICRNIFDEKLQQMIRDGYDLD